MIRIGDMRETQKYRIKGRQEGDKGETRKIHEWDKREMNETRDKGKIFFSNFN